ncbi:MAG: hypothetical protein GTO41_24100 [Burkholderiales bacterium]|nr:hypothetical protein [Burkholderiales bacterium]
MATGISVSERQTGRATLGGPRGALATMRYLFTILALLLLAACGSTGPLYLPEEQPAQVTDGPDATSESEEEETKP